MSKEIAKFKMADEITVWLIDANDQMLHMEEKSVARTSDSDLERYVIVLFPEKLVLTKNSFGILPFDEAKESFDLLLSTGQIEHLNNNVVSVEKSSIDQIETIPRMQWLRFVTKGPGLLRDRRIVLTKTDCLVMLRELKHELAQNKTEVVSVASIWEVAAPPLAIGIGLTGIACIYRFICFPIFTNPPWPPEIIERNPLIQSMILVASLGAFTWIVLAAGLLLLAGNLVYRLLYRPEKFVLSLD